MLFLVILTSFDPRFLRKPVKKQLPSTKKARNRKDDSCKYKNEGILHILAPAVFYNQL